MDFNRGTYAMRHTLLLAITLGITTLGVGCCCHHGHSRGCYDPNTGLVHKRKMFDTCGTGQCGDGCQSNCEGKHGKWYDSDPGRPRKMKSKSQGCNCQHSGKQGCRCKQSRQSSNCGCQATCDPCCDSGDMMGYDGALIPYEGTYAENGMVYEGNAVYEGGYDPNCPTCNQSGPYPTYETQNYPELMVPQQQDQKPAPAPAAEPLPTHETSISIPPASYVVPQPINGPQFPRLQRVSAH